MTGILVVNTDDTALHTVTLKHAIGMLVREVAVIDQETDQFCGVFPVPSRLRLVRYVRTDYLFSRAPGWTKRGVLRRDHYTCVYCGCTATTVDHVLPQSRGGGNTWENTVAACIRCNSRKANRTPEEARMPLRHAGFQPTRAQLTKAA